MKVLLASLVFMLCVAYIAGFLVMNAHYIGGQSQTWYSPYADPSIELFGMSVMCILPTAVLASVLARTLRSAGLDPVFLGALALLVPAPCLLLVVFLDPYWTWPNRAAALLLLVASFIGVVAAFRRGRKAAATN